MTAEQKTHLLWDGESSIKAKAQHKYIFVADGQKQRKYKLLSGADAAWNPGKNKPILAYIYVSEKRIMGLKDAVVAELKKAGQSDVDIKGWVKNAYTKDNHGEDYEAELAALNEYKKSASEQQKDRIKYGLDDLGWFIDAFKDVKEEPIDKNTKLAKASPKSKRDIFRAALQKAQDSNGKQILDVSNLDSTGAKLRNKSYKNNVSSDTISYIETDNLKTYKKAIEWAFGSTDDHEADIESVKVKLAGRKKGAKTMKGAKKPVAASTTSTTSTTTTKAEPKSESKAESKSESKTVEPVAPPTTPVSEKAEKPAAKKKQMGSPSRKAPLPGTRSPGAVLTKGGENFTQITPLKSK